MREHTLDLVLRQIGMHPDCCDRNFCETIYRDCMGVGLQGESRGMMMLPTYISADGEVPVNEKVIVMDAGGTNFRRAVAWFDENGQLQLDQFVKCPMPGTHGEVSVEEFFDEIAEYLLPIIHESERISFCFSYATVALLNMDGRLENGFCKEVQVRDSKGIEVCAELKKALARKGVNADKHCILLNDSVAALLGGKANVVGQNHDSYIGYIYGTGINCCYVEETDKIANVEGYKHNSMIINMEAGIHMGFPQGMADRLLDETSELPGDHMFEKMVSGAYLGRVMALTAQLCAERGIFTEVGAAMLKKINNFSLREVGEFFDGVMIPALEGFTEEDTAALKQIMMRLYERAAKLVSITIGSVLTWTGKGKNPECPVCICMEGTTFRKSRIFRERFFQLEKEYLNEELGVYAEFLECEDTTLAGAAIAGLLN